MLGEVNNQMRKKRTASRGTTGNSKTRDTAAMYGSNAGKAVGQKVVVSSKQQMIKRGKEEADNLSNFLPLFQKKLKDPSQGGAAMKGS